MNKTWIAWPIDTEAYRDSNLIERLPQPNWYRCLQRKFKDTDIKSSIRINGWGNDTHLIQTSRNDFWTAHKQPESDAPPDPTDAQTLGNLDQVV